MNEVYLLRGIGDSYHRCNNPDSAIHYYNIALEKAMLSSDSVVIASVYQNMSRHYCYNGKYEIALKHAHQAFDYTGYIDESLAILMAECYLENSEYDKVQQYLNALSSSNSKENKLVRLSLQHRLSTKIGDADVIQEYFDSACNVAADMYLSILKEKLELHDKNMHEELERQRAESREKIFALCLCFSIVLLALVVWLFLKYHRAKKVEKELFRAEKARLLAEETMLRKEKEHKEQIMERTRFYVKNMVSILQEVEQYRMRQKKQKAKDKQDISKSKDEHKEETRLKLKLDDKAWAEIQAYLEACEGSFVTRFKEQYPDISNSDFQLCMLLRCGFSNPELEQVYSIAAQSVKTRQLFLKDKLGIVDKTTSLRQYIKQF